MTFLLALLAASPLKASADAAYRAKDFEVACPRYERLASRGRDPWAWNDWALCETKREGFEKALTALETAAKLEQAVPEPKLRKAIDFNRRLLAEGVVACREGDVRCDSVAHALSKLVTEPSQLRRQLVARALDRLSDDELGEVPTPSFDRAIGPFASCALLTSPTCSRPLLLCAVDKSLDERPNLQGFFVDPADEADWAATDQLPRGEGLELETEWGDGGGRCPLKLRSRNVLEANACTGRMITTMSTFDCSLVATQRDRELSSFTITRPEPSAPTAPTSTFGRRYELDAAHTSARFSVKHFGIGTVTGVLGAVTGTVLLDDGSPKESAIDATIDLNGLDTKVPKRDAHLRSPDFFDVEKFPSLSFRSTKVERRAKAFVITGDLTMHGVTRPVTLTAEIGPEIINPFTQRPTRGVSARGTLDRRDWGLAWSLDTGQFLVAGTTVEIAIDAELVRSAQ